MKQYLKALAMTQSMFCALPCPFRVWDEEARPYMLPLLPAVGLEIGLLWAALAWGIRAMGVPLYIGGLLLAAFPYVITGYLHLDGFLDVTDAVKSWRDLERRREILKDSHVGAFAVIGCGLLLLGQYACALALLDKGLDPRSLIGIPVITRCGSALAVQLLPAMGTSQYAGMGASHGRVILPLCALLGTLTAGYLLGSSVWLAWMAAALGYGLALRRGYRSLEGMNGDISGYALTIGELCSLGALALL